MMAFVMATAVAGSAQDGLFSAGFECGDTAPETFTFASNLWYAWDNPSQSEPTNLPVTESDGIYSADPLLGPDDRIGSASPAAGTGETTSWSWGDAGGACFANPPSRGAFEAR